MHSSPSAREVLQCLAVGIGLVLAPLAAAQTSPLLYSQTVRLFSGGPLQFTFRDEGTGATNYIVEFSLDPGHTGSWTEEPTATITPLGGDLFQVDLPQPPQPNGFFRILALRPGGPVVANFATPNFQVTEGGTVLAVINFSGPFTGTLRYSISGTAGPGDYAPLTGEIQVTNNTQVTVPVMLTDNSTIGELKYLSLRLEPTAGVTIGPEAETTLTVEENDADWRGTLSTGNASLGFVLSIRGDGVTLESSLSSSPAGLFPTNPVPSSVVFSPTAFQSSTFNIPVTAETTLFQTPATMDLWLEAINGQEDQSVTSTDVRGLARVITRYSGKPYLNTTNYGDFYLIKPSVAPSTQRVELADAP